MLAAGPLAGTGRGSTGREPQPRVAGGRLIQAGDKQILIGVSPGRINTLHVFEEPVIDSPVQDGAYTGAQTEFARKLQGFLGKGHSREKR